MTPEQRLQAHFKQVEVNQAERKKTPSDTVQAESPEVRKAETRTGQSFGVAYGDRLQCIGAPISFRQANKWHKAEPLVVDLVSGRPVEVALVETDPVGKEPARRQAFAQFDGKVFWLCPSNEPPAKGSCVQLLGTFEDYRRGLTQPVEKPGFIRGRLRCSLGPGDGMPGIISRGMDAESSKTPRKP